MVLARISAIALLLLLAPIAPAQTTRKANDLTVPQLLDRLQDISNQEHRTPTNIIAAGENGKADLPEGLSKLQDPAPKPAAAMEELVRLGPKALADLCAHIDDARPTHAWVKGMMNLTYSAEYDWNWHSGKARPPGILDVSSFEHQVKIIGKPDPSSHTLTVGDLCFEIIGRIVNRDFEPVRYQPSAIVIVNSPVLCPDLAAAVRAEWAKLTPAQHRASLIEDVAHPDWAGRDVSAIAALQRYYPDAIPAAAVQRLKMPLYDDSMVEDFADKSLFVDPDAASRQKKLNEFFRAHGSAAKEGLLLYLWQYREAPIQHDWKVLPSVVLNQLAPNIDLRNPPHLSVLPIYSNVSFIDCLQNVASPDIDAAVWQQFTEHSRQQPPDWTPDDKVALACIARLKHKAHDADFAAYCQRRIATLGDETYRKTFCGTLDQLRQSNTTAPALIAPTSRLHD